MIDGRWIRWRSITSITNFLLAAELFYLVGLMARTPKARDSAAWFWAGAMLALATSALLGGIDHGFVEPAGLSRYWVQRPSSSAWRSPGRW